MEDDEAMDGLRFGIRTKRCEVAKVCTFSADRLWLSSLKWTSAVGFPVFGNVSGLVITCREGERVSFGWGQLICFREDGGNSMVESKWMDRPR